ncbi:permease [Candidatus Micrarchaeota archaeon]|nr:permease [Candidatus Micrarchaeota archaeon]MBU1165795.1 permease [Candidatus Micrarchaeota archaeon]MBU1886289.1 permease [Candidatus Micrarchaeota archaeon]
MTDPFELFSKWVVYELIKLEPGSTLASSLEFFIYDSPKILFLLFVMIFVMGILRTYLTQKTIRNLLSFKIPVLPNLLASSFGALTPFCSCSSIPIFIGFLEAGVSPGVAFSFLATSPLVNEYVAVLMLGFFGVEVTISYVVLGILLGTSIGLIIGKSSLRDELEDDLKLNKKQVKEQKFVSFVQRLSFGYTEAKTMLSKLWIWVILGVGVGAAIHGFVPEETIESLLSAGGIFAVPLAVLVGIPIYANCSAVVPIAVALFQKGVPLGTALAFMMATAALSLPEAIILRRVMKIRLLLLFFGLVAIGIVIIGYVFDWFF